MGKLNLKFKYEGSLIDGISCFMYLELISPPSIIVAELESPT